IALLETARPPTVLDEPGARLGSLLLGIGADLVVIPADDGDGVIRVARGRGWLVLDKILRQIGTSGRVAGAERPIGHDSAFDDIDTFQVFADSEPLDVAHVKALVTEVQFRGRLLMPNRIAHRVVRGGKGNNAFASAHVGSCHAVVSATMHTET